MKMTVEEWATKKDNKEKEETRKDRRDNEETKKDITFCMMPFQCVLSARRVCLLNTTLAYVAVVFLAKECARGMFSPRLRTHGSLLMRAARSSLKASRAVWRFGGQRMANRF